MSASKAIRGKRFAHQPRTRRVVLIATAISVAFEFFRFEEEEISTMGRLTIGGKGSDPTCSQ